MKRRKYISIVISLTVTMLFLGMIFYSRYRDQSGSLYCSPVLPRGSDLRTWKNMINPELPADKVDANFFNKFKVSSDEEKFTIDFPREEPKENPFAFELREMSPGETLNVGSGKLEFPIVGVAYRDANESRESVSCDFCDTSFRLMSEERFIELDKRNIIPYGRRPITSPYPNALFIFTCEGTEDIIFNDLKLYDSRTHHRLSTAGGPQSAEKSWYYEIDIPLWHTAPVDIVLDVSFGPAMTFEFPPVAGEGFAVENFECRLLDVFENVSTSIVTRDRIFRTLAGPRDRPGLQFYFVCQPQAFAMPVTFEILDKEGNQLRTRGGLTSAYTRIFGLTEPLEKVALIRAKYRPKRYRIVFHLPFIPGLPEKNKNIDNLFDVRIPYASFGGPSNMQQFLQRVLELNKYRRSGSIPVVSIESMLFPMELRDVTVRDIAKVFSTGGSLDADIKNDELELKYPVPLGTRIKQVWQRMLRTQR